MRRLAAPLASGGLLTAAWPVRRGPCLARQRCAAAAAAAAPPAVPAPAKQHKQQTLDFTALAACVAELDSGGWVPSKVEEVVQPDRHSLCLRLRTPLAQGWLHLSWHPTAARVCMGQPPLRGDVAEAFALSQQVSSHLKGLVLLRAHLPAPFERVACLDFGARPGEPASRSLYCEVMANYSNVVLTGADSTILQAAFQVGGAMSSLRQVQQGRPYQLPPCTAGIQPSAGEPLEAWRDNIVRAAELAASERGAAAGARRGLQAQRSHQQQVQPQPQPQQPSLLAGATRAYLGVSPSLMEELCCAAGVARSAAPAQLTPADWAALHAAWQAWLARLQHGDYAPCSCPASGRFSVLGSYSQPAGSVAELLDSTYRSLQAAEVYGALHLRLSAAVRAALRKARGRVAAFEGQLRAAEGAGALQRQADVIVANLYRIPEGAAQLRAEDWDTGEPLTLALDPGQPPAAQAEALFRRARKLRRAVDAVGPLLEGARGEVAYLETVELELSQMPPGGAEQELAALREVQEELVESRVIKPPPEAALSAKAAAKGRKAAKRQAKASPGSAAAAAAAAAGGAGLRQYESPGGFVVLVGRNNKQNDVLSHQVAKPGDLWMHVRGLPGSHTVLKLAPGRGEPSRADLQFAADLAAWFSKAREAGKADVIVARAEHLKKPRGAKPGQVLVSKEETNVIARPGQSAAALAGGSSGGA